MRIIAGTWRGRVLSAPRGNKTRPTSDRVREALFSILGPIPAETRVLDLFAGSGAIGLEALSRGAKSVQFVEYEGGAQKTLIHNIEAFQCSARAKVVKQDALRFLASAKAGSFDWIFIDPPYQSDLANSSIALIVELDLLGPGGMLVVEHDKRIKPNDFSPALVKAEPRRYGDTCLTLFRSAT